MAEAGLGGIDVVNYFGIMASAGTPEPIVATLNAALNRMTLLPEVIELWAGFARFLWRAARKRDKMHVYTKSTYSY